MRAGKIVIISAVVAALSIGFSHGENVVQLTSSYKETPKDGGQAADNYALTIKVDVSGIDDFVDGVDDDTNVFIGFDAEGTAFNFSSTVGDAAKSALKPGKGGKITYVTRTDGVDQTIRLSWNAKSLTVVLKGKTSAGASRNLLDFESELEEQAGEVDENNKKVSDQVSGRVDCVLRVGDWTWSSDSIPYSGIVKSKYNKKLGTSLGFWKVKGRGSVVYGGDTPVCQVSGTVSGDVVEGVTLSLVGDEFTKTTTSDGDGGFIFWNVSNGDYVLTPSLTGYSFDPTSRDVTVSGADVGDLNFVSSTYSISGAVTGDVTEGVSVTLSGDGDATVTTDSDGAYQFEMLVAGSYTITPSYDGVAFVPESRDVTIKASDVDSVDFIAVSPSSEITFVDSLLEAKVKESLGISADSPVTVERAWTVTSLDLSDSGVSNLTGLEYFTNLTTLLLNENFIVNINALSSLENLIELNLSENDVYDLRPLKALVNLKTLDLGGNRIKDIWPLENLTSLEVLDISDNIDVITFLPLKELENLVSLNLEGIRSNHQCQKGLSFLNGFKHLKSLRAYAYLGKTSYVYYCPVDPELLSKLSGLTELSFWDHSIRDLSCIAHLTELESLCVDSRAITDINILSTFVKLKSLTLILDRVEDLSPIAGLENLEVLSLNCPLVTDYSLLANFPNLKELTIACVGDNDEQFIDNIKNPSQLRKLCLSEFKAPNANCLDAFTNLEKLELSGEGTISYAAFAKLRELIVNDAWQDQYLDLDTLPNGTLECLTVDCSNDSIPSKIAHLTSLKHLDLYVSDALVNTNPLVALVNLRKLRLDGTRVGNIAFISEMKDLNYFSLDSLYGADLQPIEGLTKMKHLELDIPKTDVSVETFTPMGMLSYLDLYVSTIAGEEMFQDLKTLDYLELDCQDVAVDGDALALPSGIQHIGVGAKQGTVSLSFLRYLTELSSFQANDRTYLSYSDPSIFQNLTNMLQLNFGYGVIVCDPAIFQNMKEMSSLDIRVNSSVNLDYLAKLEDLTSLVVFFEDEGSLSDLSFLGEFDRLARLWMDGNWEISDISAISDQKNLRSLILGNPFDTSSSANLEALAKLEEMLYFECNECNVTDVSFATSWDELRILVMETNGIVDVSPLASIKVLRKASFLDNMITDLSPLRNNIYLTQLNVSKNNISDIECMREGFDGLFEFNVSNNALDTSEGTPAYETIQYLESGGCEVSY